jgi:flavin reductase (DIM6/NTAB) family NADH-FMN oxidoreductase RutF
MDIDLAKTDSGLCYKLISSLVVPRPIALISSVSPNGVVNAAPYSFFNLMGDDPPILIVSIEHRLDGTMKDSSRNMTETGEFVVNLVDEALADRMHACSTAYPPEVSEPEVLGLALAPSATVKPPRLADAPASLECTLHQTISIGERRLLLIGKIQWLHVRDGILDPQTFRVNMSNYFPVGRLFADRYIRTRDQFIVDTSPDFIERVKAQGRM